MTFRYGSACYEIEVHNPDGYGQGINTAELDSVVIEERPLRVRLSTMERPIICDLSFDESQSETSELESADVYGRTYTQRRVAPLRQAEALGESTFTRSNSATVQQWYVA